MADLPVRPLPPWAQDGLLAGFAALMQVTGTRNAALTNGLAPPDQLGYALLVASAVVLLARRRLPVTVFTVNSALSAAYYLSGNPDGATWFALFIAAYTVAAYGDGRRSLRIVAGTLTVLTVIWLVTADLQPVAEAGWVAFRIGMIVMAPVLGESIRSRRVIAAEALARAEHAERTREEEAARRVDAERLRIAREVHDTVAHALAIVNVQAGVTAHVLDKRPEQAREALLTIEQTSARALRELREALGMLRDTAAEELAPSSGLDQLSEIVRTAREAGVEVRTEVEPRPPEVDLPSAVDRAAYRILQESITNVIRHARPARATVTVRWHPHELEIEVADDGPGSTATGAGGGRGIAGMRERCVLLGGDLTAGPGPAGGFRVRARLPLTPAAAVAR